MNLYKVKLNYIEFYVVASSWNEAVTKLQDKATDFNGEITNIELLARQNLSQDGKQYFFNTLDYFII